MVCCEPDWGTFTLLSDDVRTSRAVAQSWGESFRNGWIGRQLKEMLIRGGLLSVELSGHLLFTDGCDSADRVFDISVTIERLRRDDPNGSHRYSRWREDYEADKNRGCCASVTLFLVSGVKTLT